MRAPFVAADSVTGLSSEGAPYHGRRAKPRSSPTATGNSLHADLAQELPQRLKPRQRVVRPVVLRVRLTVPAAQDTGDDTHQGKEILLRRLVQEAAQKLGTVRCEPLQP